MQSTLCGSADRIRQVWEDDGITGMIIAAHQPEALELMAGLAGVTDTKTVSPQ
jgi:hypothetical protein